VFLIPLFIDAIGVRIAAAVHKTSAGDSV